MIAALSAAVETAPPSFTATMLAAMDDPGVPVVLLLCAAFVAWVLFAGWVIADTLVVEGEADD